MNKLVRSVVGVIFTSVSVLSLLGLVLYAESWEESAVKAVSMVGVASLFLAVVCIKWEDVKTFPRDLHEFCFEDEVEPEQDPHYVDTSDQYIPYQSPWTLGETQKAELPPAKVRW